MNTNNIPPKPKIHFEFNPSAETIRAVFKNIPIPTFVWQKSDNDLVLVDYNDAAMEITEGRINEILGNKTYELYPDMPKIRRELLDCFNNKMAFETEKLYRFKTTGERKYLSVKYVFVPPDLVLVHTEDITFRKKTENRLKASEKKYRELANLLPQTVYETDAAYNITYCNQAGFDAFGHTQDDLHTGLNVFELVIPEEREKVLQNIIKVTKGEDSGGNEYIALRKDGSTFPASVYSLPITRNGKVIGMRGIVTDISRLKEAQMALLKANDELEQRVKERTVELAEANKILKAEIAERKRMEGILKSNEEKYRAVVEQSAESIFLIDLKTRYLIEANPSFQKLLGFETEEIPRIHMYDFIAHDRDDIEQKLDIVIKKGEHFIGERKYKKKDGTLVDVEVSVNLIDNNGEKVICVVARDISQRKKFEDALVEKERFIRSTVNSLSANIAILNDQGEIVYVNKSWIDFAHDNGLNGNFVDENYLNVCDRARDKWADEAPLVSANIRKVISGEIESFSIEYPCHSSQEQRWFQMSVTRFVEPGLVFVVVAHENITELKLAEEALRQSERRYCHIVEDQTDLICRHLPDGTITFVNQAYCRFFNKKREEITNKFNLPFFQNNELEIIMTKRLSLTLKKHITSYEHKMIRYDGKIRWFHRTDCAIFDEKNMIHEYQSVARDITARKQAEEELEKYRHHLEDLVKERTQALNVTNQKLNKELIEHKRAEMALQLNKRRYELLYEENPSMYFTIDLKGKILSVNKFGADQLEYSVKELLGKSVYNIIYKEDRKILQNQLKDMFVNIKSVFSWEFRKVRKNGTIIWVKELARRITDDDGTSLILIVCEDITDKIKAQIERKKLEKQLAEREKLALLGQFTAAITHEINNPLDIIITKIDALQDDHHHLPAFFAETEKIKEQVFKISHLVRDIMVYVKPHPPELHPVDVNKILIQTIELVQLYHGEDIRIKTKLKPNLPMITADAIGLEIVFKNIILNAIQSFKQEGLINIMTQRTKDGQLRITIKDNGPGIEKSRLKKIFDQFYTSKKDTGGTGLGLAIALEIVKKHHGTINVKSRLGEGTTFHANLPFHNTA